ncbi:ankyrin repeat-containing domain protein [Umbelopsis sp. PMI_123]|nr:ankyrin repeat-containing domain protein [Umbelopsis sp. PMI_123]
MLPFNMNTLPTPPVSPEVVSTGMKRPLESGYTSASSKRPTPLRTLWRSVYERRMDVKALKRYLHRNHNLDINDARGFSVFYHACRTSSIDAIQYLLNLSQIDINKRYGPLQATVLHAVVCVGSAATVDLLLRQNNINVNLTTVNGHTPLHIAALVKSVMATEKLLAAGADTSIVDHCGHTPLHLAISQGSLPTVKCFLANKSANSQHHSSTTNITSPLIHAISLGHYSIMRELIKAGEDINGRDHLQRTPLDVAIAFQRYDCMSYLVDCRAEQSITQKGTTNPPDLSSKEEKPNDIRKLMSLEFWTNPSSTM